MSKMGRKNKDSKEAAVKKMRQQLAALERKNAKKKKGQEAGVQDERYHDNRHSGRNRKREDYNHKEAGGTFRG